MEWTRITYDTFSPYPGYWGNFESGGSFAKINKKKKHAKVGYSIKISRDQGEESSFMHKANLKCSKFTKLKVTFWYYTKKMIETEEHGKDKFVLEYASDGG